MTTRYVPLSRKVTDLHPSYALYVLRHEPTKRMYFGSTENLPQRLMNWIYMFEATELNTNVPKRMLEIFHTHGRHMVDWTYAIVDRERPNTYKPRAPTEDKPEWRCVQWALANAPALLINDPLGKRRGRPVGSNRRHPSEWGPRGVSPIKYLGIMLGIYQGYKWSKQPPCARPIDPRTLEPQSHTDVPFATYLLRAMKKPPTHLNPSAAAIDELYQKWLAAQPAGYRETVPGTITTAQGALELPDPSVWMKSHA